MIDIHPCSIHLYVADLFISLDRQWLVGLFWAIIHDQNGGAPWMRRDGLRKDHRTMLAELQLLITIVRFVAEG